jgi:Bacterial membrane protein YfhO
MRKGRVLGRAYELVVGSSYTHAMCVFFGFLGFYTLFFSPVLLHRQLLAFGDGMGYYLPAYYSAKSLWTDLISGGYPLAADPQNMTWYPPVLLLSWIPGSWNFFIILAYGLAGSFSYYYVYTLTASRLAGVVAGVTYSMSGFMMSHLSMATMLHAAAWIPLLLCALEKLRHSVRRRWLLMAVIAFVCCFFGGNPQISIYGLGLGMLYALFLGWKAPIGRWKYYRHTIGVVVISLGICAIQWLPTAELSRLSIRAEMTQEGFFAGSLPLQQSLQYIFPFLFGSGMSLPPYSVPYWAGGEANPVDIATYVGILPLILAAIGVVANRRSGIARFWFGVAIIIVIIIFGKHFFLAKLMYYVPIYNIFRSPARHAIELALAVSTLAGLGVSSIQQRLISKRVVWQILIIFSLVIFLAVMSIALSEQGFQIRLRQLGITGLTFLPWSNPAVGVPLVIFSCSLLAVIIYFRSPQSILSSLTVLTVLTLDMASYGFWFHNWSSTNIMYGVDSLKSPPFYQRYQSIIDKNDQRLLVQGGTFLVHEVGLRKDLVFPNINRLWGIPVSNGYSPLMISRMNSLLRMDMAGVFLNEAISDQDRSFDLMSTKYLLSQQLLMTEKTDVDFQASMGSTISPNILPLVLSGPSPESRTNNQSILIELPKNSSRMTTIDLETSLGKSVNIPNNSVVMNLQVIDTDGSIEEHSLLTGRDTAEQAFDCPDVKPLMKHDRAKVSQSVTVSRNSGTCESYTYKSIVTLDKPHDVKQLQLELKIPSVIMEVRRITLSDPRNEVSLPITSLQPVLKMTKWREIEHLGSGAIYENKTVLPRAWIVSDVLQLKPEEILQSIHTSRLPNGQTYLPEKTALIEVENSSASLPNRQSSNLPPGKVEILQIADTKTEIQTDSTDPAFLVLSDVNYPGWQVWIDGQPTKIFQTNYVQRGVNIPAGKHLVRFEFHPWSFKLGAGIAMASIFGGLYGLMKMKPTIGMHSMSSPLCAAKKTE